jgi:pimeloyl-ACP methyl ester carboxylesterase
MRNILTAILCAIASLAVVASVHAEEVRLEFSGTTLNANLTLAEGKTLRDDVVLITHGTLAHNKMEIVKNLQALLQEAGRSSLAINLALGAPDREFMYECKTPHTHLFHDAMKEIGAWVEWLGSQGTRSVTLVGHSRGGNQTAWFTAETDHALVSKVVLIAPATWDLSRTAKSYRKNHRRNLADVLARARALVDAGKPASMLEKTGMLYCKGATVSAASFVSYYTHDERRHTPALLPRLKKPTLIIAGSDDKVVVGLDKLIPPHLKEKSQRFENIEGAGHFFRDLYVEDVVELIVEFIEE